MCFNIILSFFFLPYFILFITFLLRVPTHIYRLERYDFICFGGKSFSFSCFGGLRKKTKMKVLISLLFDVPILHFAKSKFMLFVNKSCIAYFFKISTYRIITFRSILQSTLQTMKNVLPSETLNESYMDNSCLYILHVNRYRYSKYQHMNKVCMFKLLNSSCCYSNCKIEKRLNTKFEYLRFP